MKNAMKARIFPPWAAVSVGRTESKPIRKRLKSMTVVTA
jgi:hypothetical protein